MSSKLVLFSLMTFPWVFALPWTECDFAFRLCLPSIHDHMMFRFMMFLVFRIYAEEVGENKWKEMKETERTMEGNWKDNGLGSGFWCPLTSFDMSFGRRSDVVRNLEQHAYGIPYFPSFSRFCGGLAKQWRKGESSLCCDHFHLTSTCGESSAFQYDLFVFS